MTPEKILVGSFVAEMTIVVPESAGEETQDVPPHFSEGDGAEPRRGFKRPRLTLGSTSTSFLEGLVHANPCFDVPLHREIMARFDRPSVMGDDPSAHARSMIGPAASRENMLRGIPQFRVPEEEKRPTLPEWLSTT